MKLDREYVTSEDDAKITWAKNGAASYAVVNKDKLNDHGEAPGYRIFPSTSPCPVIPYVPRGVYG